MANVKQLQVNGTRQVVDADPDRSLLSVLRDDLALTGSKYGCGEGECGACTVLLDGRRTRSCVTRVGDAEGKSVRTIEGVSDGDRLHPLQQAFLDADAMQCAYCTSGMIMSALALLEDRPNPTRDEICRGMNGNICRCGTYNRIITAITQAARTMKVGAK
jgi:aerobic-type carbon monoxide dehydrogenase small subunit (CoxS/CutS family)